MKYRALLGIALLAIPASMLAKSLSPDQALQLYASQQAKAPSITASAPTLAYTAQENGTPAAYIFAGAEGKGFVVLAADDAIGNIVLGYSEDSEFDASNMPISMQWWLEGQSHAVLRSAEFGPSESLRGNRAPAHATLANIPAICQTKWNQDAPYNNLCPVLGGRRAVTGCIATAMAQIMKVYQWPATGTGSLSYTYKYNNQNQTASADFGATTYDWDNMLNRYYSSSSATQKTAVATLMYHCGVASRMSYDPDGSGASEYDAGAGMIDYFNYDKGMEIQDPSWYTKTEWTNLLHAELSAGRPVLYTGANAYYEGHAFVCDGYQDGLFHINWGWGGVSDGYFDIGNLNPESLGIGGGSEADGFNYYQSVLTNIRKPVAGSQACGKLAMYYGESLTTSKNTYSRNSYTNVTFKGFVYAAALKNASYDIGLRLGTGDDAEYITVYANQGLGPMYGFDRIDYPANYFPVGEYDVVLVYKSNGSTWQEVKYDVLNSTNGVHFKVTASEIKVSELPKEFLEFVGFDFGQSTFPGTSPNLPATVAMTPPTIKATVHVGSADQEINATLNFYNKSGNTFIYSTEAQPINAAEHDSDVTIEFVGPWAALEENTTYCIRLYTDVYGQVRPSYYVKIKNNGTDGIEIIETEPAQNAEYYNLQGIRVANPVPGQLYILKRGNSASKVLYSE